MIKNQIKLLSLFERRTKKIFLFLFFLMLLTAFLETIGIGLVVSFVTLISSPEQINDNSIIMFISSYFNITGNQILLKLSYLILFFFIIKGFILSILYYLQFRFVFSERSIFGKKLIERFLYRSYAYHLNKSRAELQRNLDIGAGQVFAYVQALLAIITELCIVICIMIFITISDPIISIINFTFLSVIGIIFYSIVQKYSTEWGQIIQNTGKNVNKVVIESFGAIKELKMANKESFFSNYYFKNMIENARAKWNHSTINLLPNIIIEVAAIACIIIVTIFYSFYLSKQQDMLPTIALFAVASVRLRPSISKIVSNFQQLRFYSPALDIIHNELKLDGIKPLNEQNNEPSKNNTICLNQKLKLENVSYHYPESKKEIIKNISLDVKRGDAVAFVGPTGSGKSTLSALILGLLKPTGGEIKVDGEIISKNLLAWRKNIGYVPQSIYLLDADIKSNIAFGYDSSEIDVERVSQTLKMANIDNFVKNLPMGMDTIIGENGVRLSGGERQRIGIARALYNQPDFLVFDEATSALDSNTEKIITETINKLMVKKTMIIIAHRLSTVKNCDQIYFLNDGFIQYSGRFEELYTNNHEFKKLVDSSLS